MKENTMERKQPLSFDEAIEAVVSGHEPEVGAQYLEQNPDESFRFCIGILKEFQPDHSSGAVSAVADISHIIENLLKSRREKKD